jgi:hypothetical protein
MAAGAFAFFAAVGFFALVLLVAMISISFGGVVCNAARCGTNHRRLGGSCEQRIRGVAVLRARVPGRCQVGGRYPGAAASGRVGPLPVWVRFAAAPARPSRSDGKRINRGLGWPWFAAGGRQQRHGQGYGCRYSANPFTPTTDFIRVFALPPAVPAISRSRFQNGSCSTQENRAMSRHGRSSRKSVAMHV